MITENANKMKEFETLKVAKQLQKQEIAKQYDKMIKLSEEQKKSDAEAKERIRQRQKSNIIVWDYP